MSLHTEAKFSKVRHRALHSIPQDTNDPMNAFARNTLVAIALVATFAGPASAISTGNLRTDVQSAVSGSGNVNVSLSDGVATLTGDADSLSKVAAERAALASPEVSRVVNLIDAD